MTSSRKPALMNLDHDLALHPFEGDGSLCAACGEARNWHEDRPPIPDAPNMPPWVLAHAEYEGRTVELVDIKPALAACTCGNLTSDSIRWRVGAGQPAVSTHDSACPVRTRARTFPSVCRTDDYAAALAEYHRQAALLCDGGGEGE